MRKISITLLVASLVTFPLIGYATQRSTCDSLDLHCTHFTGASGKYVAITDAVFGQQISCEAENSQEGISMSLVWNDQMHVGETYKIDYKQCSNWICSESIPIDVESFTITKIGNERYSSNPPTHTVQLNPGYGESCDPNTQKEPIGVPKR